MRHRQPALPGVNAPTEIHVVRHVAADAETRYNVAALAAAQSTCHERCPDRFRCRQQGNDQIAAYLLRDLAIRDHGGGYVFTQRSLADLLCLTRPTLERALHRLSCRGLIALNTVDRHRTRVEVRAIECSPEPPGAPRGNGELPPPGSGAPRGNGELPRWQRYVATILILSNQSIPSFLYSFLPSIPDLSPAAQNDVLDAFKAYVCYRITQGNVFDSEPALHRYFSKWAAGHPGKPDSWYRCPPGYPEPTAIVQLRALRSGRLQPLQASQAAAKRRATKPPATRKEDHAAIRRANAEGDARWAAIRTALQADDDAHDKWFKPMQPHFDDATLTLWAPSSYVVETVKERWLAQIVAHAGCDVKLNVGSRPHVDVA